MQNYIKSLQRLPWCHYMEILCLELHSEQLIDSTEIQSSLLGTKIHWKRQSLAHISVNNFVSTPPFHPSPRNTFWTRKSWQKRWHCSSENPELRKHGCGATPVCLRVHPSTHGTRPKRPSAFQPCILSTFLQKQPSPCHFHAMLAYFLAEESPNNCQFYKAHKP